GEFSTRLNVDDIQSVTVQPGHVDARYAHASAGVVSMESQSGDERWRFGTTNFLPDLSFESGLRLGNWFPRFTSSGPIVHGRLWFSDGLSFQHALGLVPELPRSDNAYTQFAGDNLLRLRFKANNTHMLEGSYLWNGSSSRNVGLGPFSPAPTTTTNTATYNF